MNPFMPMNDAVLTAAMEMFSKVSNILTLLVSMIFIIRVSLLVATVSGPFSYSELLKDTFVYFGLIKLFPIFVKLIVQSTSGIAEKISFVPQVQAQEAIQATVDKLFGESIFFRVLGRIGDLAIIYVANTAYTSLISLLLAVAPVVIFLNSMLGISHGIKIYFGVLMSLCLWPTFWNLLGLFGRELSSQMGHSPFSSAIFWLVIQAFQIISPILCIFLFSSLSASPGFSKTMSIARILK